MRRTRTLPEVASASLRERFDREGFVHLPGMLSHERCAAVRHGVETAPERTPGDNPLSLGTMRFASNLFYGSEVLRALLCSPDIVELVTALVGPDAWVRWDQAVWKDAGAPRFPLHQDNGYTGLEASHLQLWFALTPMDEANGGLVVVPGAHHLDLPHHWEGNHVATDTDLPRLAIAAETGDVIAFSSRLPHETTPNGTDRPRLAYVAEYLPCSVEDPTVEWPHLIASQGGRPSGAMVPAPAPAAPAPAPAAPSPGRRGWRGWLRPRPEQPAAPVDSDDA